MIGIAIGMIAVLGDGREIDGEAAVQIARNFARAVGVREKLEVTGLGEVDSAQWRIGSGKMQSVTFAFPDKRWARVFVSKKGEVEWFQVVQPGQSPQSNEKLPPGRDVDLANRLLKPTHPTASYELRPFDKGVTGPYRNAYFDITIAGHRFFNLNPTYAYNIQFDGRTGEASWFSRPQEIPRPVATTPRIPANKAMAMLEHWAKTHYIHGRGNASMFGPSSPWNPTTVAELGYYKFQHEPKARLVWEAHVWTHFMKTPSTDAGPLRMYVDAVTGELISPDDPGIG